jgi:hypothetical protein
MIANHIRNICQLVSPIDNLLNTRFTSKVAVRVQTSNSAMRSPLLAALGASASTVLSVGVGTMFLSGVTLSVIKKLNRKRQVRRRQFCRLALARLLPFTFSPAHDPWHLQGCMLHHAASTVEIHCRLVDAASCVVQRMHWVWLSAVRGV